jgi:cell division transport system permease protein
VIHFLAFAIKRAIQGLWRNGVMSLAATITMVLMLLLLAGLLIVSSSLQVGLDTIESKVEVLAFINDGVSEERVEALRMDVEALPEVESATFTTKEQALEEFRATQAAAGNEDLTRVTGTNPIPAKLNIKLQDPRVFGQVRATLLGPPGVVQEVIDTQETVDELLGITGVLRTAGLITIAVVGLTVLLIVVNTIRMAVMSRRDEIEIMRLVGASDGFVRWPFIFEGVLVGLLGAVVTLGLLALASQPIGQLARIFAAHVPPGFQQSLAQQVIGVVLVAGLILGGLGAGISVRTYLRR